MVGFFFFLRSVKTMRHVKLKIFSKVVVLLSKPIDFLRSRCCRRRCLGSLLLKR